MLGLDFGGLVAECSVRWRSWRSAELTPDDARGECEHWCVGYAGAARAER